MSETKLLSLVQVYLYCHFYYRVYENSRFESDKFPFLFWKISKIPVLELVANKIGKSLTVRHFLITGFLLK